MIFKNAKIERVIGIQAGVCKITLSSQRIIFCASVFSNELLLLKASSLLRNNEIVDSSFTWFCLVEIVAGSSFGFSSQSLTILLPCIVTV